MSNAVADAVIYLDVCDTVATHARSLMLVHTGQQNYLNMCL